MTSRKDSKAFGVFAILAVALSLVVAACSSSPPDAHQNTPELTEITATPAGDWQKLLHRAPYPYLTPLPPPTPTVLDGTYVKFDPRPGKRAPCRRCPPYPPEGGVWRLNLDKGTFRVYHDGTGWLTLGSFTVSGDRVEFFNDPHCYESTGAYTWELEDGKLILEVTDDGCGVYLRKQNFVALPWESCQPPSEEAAITDHWPKPAGCD